MNAVVSLLIFLSLMQCVFSLDQMDAPRYDNLTSTSFNIIFDATAGATEYFVDLAERHSSRVRRFRVAGSGETISNLDSNKIYDVTVKAINSTGAESLASPSTKVYTLPGAPNLHLSSPLPDSVFVFFNMRHNSRVSRWQIQYHKVADPLNVITVNTTENDYYAHVLSNLSPLTSYSIKARALKVTDTYVTRELTEDETSFSDSITFTTDSLTVFGRVTLVGVPYNKSYEYEGSISWNMSLLELENAYRNAGISVNGSIKIEGIANVTSEAAAHFRISGVQNTTGYDIPVSSKLLKNTIFNLDAGPVEGSSNRLSVFRMKDRAAPDGISFFLYIGRPTSPQCLEADNYEATTSLLISPETENTFEVSPFTTGEITGEPPQSELYFRTSSGSDVTSIEVVSSGRNTLNQSVTLGIVPKYVTTDCPVYSLNYRPWNYIHNHSQEPILFTTVAGNGSWSQSDYLYEPESATRGSLSISAHDKIVKFEVYDMATGTVVGRLNEEDMDGSDRWKIQLNVSASPMMLQPKVSFRTNNGSETDVVDGYSFVLNSTLSVCNSCSSESTCETSPTDTTILNPCICKEHFTGNGTTCTRMNYCNSTSCPSNSNCTEKDIIYDNEEYFHCSCHTGFLKDGAVCMDINECTDGTHGCDANATCSNNNGSYSCKCNRGYSGNGFLCEDINECTEGTHGCDANATCSNNNGSYSCNCNNGYSGSGFDCSDIDECSENINVCHQYAQCTNVPGSYYCNCSNGNQGNGTHCECIDGYVRVEEICQPNCSLSYLEFPRILTCESVETQLLVIAAYVNGTIESQLACDDIPPDKKYFNVIVNDTLTFINELIPGLVYRVLLYDATTNATISNDTILIPPYETPTPNFKASNDSIMGSWDKPYNGTEYQVTFKNIELPGQYDRALSTTDAQFMFDGLESGYRHEICITLTFCQAASPGLKKKCGISYTLPGPVEDYSFETNGNILSCTWIKSRGTESVEVSLTMIPVARFMRITGRSSCTEGGSEAGNGTSVSFDRLCPGLYSFAITPINSAGNGESRRGEISVRLSPETTSATEVSSVSMATSPTTAAELTTFSESATSVKTITSPLTTAELTTMLESTSPELTSMTESTTSSEMTTTGLESSSTVTQSTETETTTMEDEGLLQPSTLSNPTNVIGTTTFATTEGTASTEVTEGIDDTTTAMSTRTHSMSFTVETTTSTSIASTSFVASTVTTTYDTSTMSCEDLCALPNATMKHCPADSCEMNRTQSTFYDRVYDCICNVPGSQGCADQRCQRNNYCDDEPCDGLSCRENKGDGFICTARIPVLEIIIVILVVLIILVILTILVGRNKARKKMKYDVSRRARQESGHGPTESSPEGSINHA